MVELCRMNTLTVSRVDTRGVWLDAGGELAHLPRRQAPDAVPGERVEAFVYLDAGGKLQATLKHPVAQAGEFALLTVKSVGPHGAFLDWGLEKDLLAPYSLQPERMKERERHLVLVDIDEQGRPFANARIDECLDTARPDVGEGDAVTVVIWKISDLGAKVIVNDRYPGLLYRDELTSGIRPGVRITGYVKRVRVDGKLDVTLRPVGAAGRAEAREVILDALAVAGGFLPLHDGSSPEAVRASLGLSKKAFKKGVGALYKEGIVTVTDTGIALKGT